MKWPARFKQIFPFLLICLVLLTLIGTLKTRGIFGHSAPETGAARLDLTRSFSDHNKVPLSQLNRVEVLYAKAGPESAWSLQLERREANAPLWIITRNSNGNIPGDQGVNAEFLENLIESISSPKSVLSSMEITKEPAETTGLGYPRLKIRLWTTSTPDARLSYEIHVGNLSSSNPDAIYAQQPGALPVLIQGRLPILLQQMERADCFRSPYWVGLNASELEGIRRIEWRRKGKVAFSAIRDPAGWKDLHSEQVSRDIAGWLERIALSRFRQIVDSVEAGQRFKKILLKSADLGITLWDRNGLEIQIHLGRIQERIIGISSFRPQAVFEISEETLREFQAQ
jgi:hypothetical protein